MVDDHLTGMDIAEISSLLYDYTSGYLYLVSRICKIMDEELISDPEFADQTSVWTKNGFLKTVRQLLQEQSPLFESLIGKTNDYPELKKIIHRLLFEGQNIAYNLDDPAI